MKHSPFFPCAGARALHAPTRRGFLYSLGASLGSVAFTSLLGEETKKNPLAPKDGHLPAKAKNVTGRTVREIATSTRRSESAVKMTLLRLRQQLSECIQRQLFTSA